jgi:hypothetical protein
MRLIHQVPIRLLLSHLSTDQRDGLVLRVGLRAVLAGVLGHGVLRQLGHVLGELQQP